MPKVWRRRRSPPVTPTDGSGMPGPMFALVGLACALLSRWGTGWTD